jgi:hypothetical protein
MLALRTGVRISIALKRIGMSHVKLFLKINHRLVSHGNGIAKQYIALYGVRESRHCRFGKVSAYLRPNTWSSFLQVDK